MSEATVPGPWARRSAGVRMAGLLLAVAALPWSNALISIGQMVMVLGWAGEGLALGELGRRFRRVLTQRWPLAFIGYFLLHVAGIAWSQDLEWALDLCRILLPVLVFGVVLSTAPPMGERAVQAVLRTGAWSVVLSTVACLALAGDQLRMGDHRAVSIFISHVRLGLLLALAVCVFLADRPASRPVRAAQWAAALWAVAFMVIAGNISGLAVLGGALVVMAWRGLAGARPAVRRSLRAALAVLTLAVPLVLLDILWPRPPAPVDPAGLEAFSAGGEAYYHDLADPQWENGHPVWTCVADEELQRGWARRSKVDYHALDALGQPLRGTLVRYLASMGLRKDSLGVLALTAEDVRRIEQGMPSVRTGREPLLSARLRELRLEIGHYRSVGDANGHSLTMRLVYWRTGWWIARRNLWTGVGTGDTRPAFAHAYEELRSPLAPPWRHRAHDQFLTLLISFGLPGLLFALFSWTAPVVAYRAWNHPVFSAWATIFLLSCLTEDTVETQVGATFFALYYGLFVFGGRWLNAQVGPPTEAPPRARA